MPTAKNVQVAVIGVGLVGSEFISQVVSYIARQSNPASAGLLTGGSTLSLISLSSSRHTLAPLPSPLPSSFTSGWKSSLAGSTQEFSLGSVLSFLSARKSESGTDSEIVLVDNTASPAISSSYPQFLRAGINVVTPNKKGFSGEQGLWNEILHAAKEGNSRFLNEATVGAGLPVVGTLKDLVATGDEITKIEGVFSGTLSYIFNSFSPPSPPTTPTSFSSIVSTARSKGYTEPHPGDDLSGADVARKLCILSRLIPSAPTLQHGYASVDIKSLVPKELADVQTGEEFVKRLPEFDAGFESMRKEADDQGKVIRYVGVIDLTSPGQAKAEAKLERYPKAHPLAASLSGADNIVLFHTKRYAERPLIVQGAGAGAAVTAMGVLSDVLRFL